MTVAVMIEKMSEGLGRTCGIFFLTLLFSLPLGLIMALLRRSRFAVVRGIMRGAISVLRGTPLMLQLLAVTYGPFYISKALKDILVAALATESFMAGLGEFAVFVESALGWLPFVDIEASAVVQYVCELPKEMLIKIPANKLIPIIVGFSINYAAYFAEIYRGGIESMPVGQYEAAAVLGYNKFRTFIRIPNEWGGPQEKSYEAFREYLYDLYANIPEGVTETYLHPAYECDELKNATGVWYRRVWEHRVMSDPKTKQHIEAHGIKLINYRQLAAMNR